MKIITGTLLISAVWASIVQADIKSCPGHCTCTFEGANGVGAYCSKLNVTEQRFAGLIQHLNIINQNISHFSLSDNIFGQLGLKDLESIKIVNSSLDDISVKAFQGLAQLFDVNLSDNLIFLIHPDTFANNTNLRRLKLSGNPLQLTQLLKTPHEYLLRSSSLTDLDLSNCQLAQILPKTFSQLKNLVFINLSSNYLKAIPKDVFEGLDSLEDLDLSNNQISKIDKNAFKLNKNLSVLKVKKNPIETISGINLPELEELHLSECKLRVLMKETIEGMPLLSQLYLNSNQIELISDDSFADLSELKVLDLSNNKLIGPMARDLFKNNRNLEQLLLSGNRELSKLVEEPGFVDAHKTLSKLELADCGLTNMTAGQLTGLDNLNVLNISHNMIKSLAADTFAKMQSLHYLDLSHNKLESLPMTLFASNKDLSKLWLRGNPLKQLSLNVFSYTENLKFLDASGCGLEKLWDQHRHPLEGHKLLSRLSFLDISNNSISNLQVYDFHTMDALEMIDLAGNPIMCVSPTIQLIEYFIKKEVDPHLRSEKLLENGKPDKVKWNEIITGLCPVRQDQPSSAPVAVSLSESQPRIALPSDAAIAAAAKAEKILQDQAVSSLVPGAALMESAHSTYTRVDEIVVEDSTPSSYASSIMWPTILAASVLIVALYFIIYLAGEITHRRRTVLATYARPGSLGGHVRTRGASGSPLYYKLYEECSIPAQPVKTKKNYILDFSPVHTILKKGTYKIMKTNEVNV